MIVKYLVAILDLDHRKCNDMVEKVLLKVEAERREAELRRVRREAERREAELKRVIERMIENQGKESNGGTAAFRFSGEMDVSTGGVEDLETGGSGNFESPVEPSDATPGEEVEPVIKIPYLHCCDVKKHKLIIMEDMGLNLAEWLSFKTEALQVIWSDSSNRRAFYEDVVLTLLNLAGKYSLSHNDIRMANIALGQNGRFCVLDFDMSEEGFVSSDSSNSILLKNIADEKPKIFVFTILQLSLVIFQLDSLLSNSSVADSVRVVRKVSNEWLGWGPQSKTRVLRRPKESAQDQQVVQPALPRSFESWLLSQHHGLKDLFFSAGEHRSVGDEVGYFKQIMKSVLKI